MRGFLQFPLNMPSPPLAPTSSRSSRSRHRRHEQLDPAIPAAAQPDKAMPTSRELLTDRLVIEGQSQEPQIKRRRIALACGTCRSRKSKVSREYTSKINTQCSTGSFPSALVNYFDHAESVTVCARNAQCAWI